MKLTVSTRYPGLLSFPPQDIPDFTLLTGLNGTGKSRLLAAISGSHVLVDDLKRASDSDNTIVLFPSAAAFGFSQRKPERRQQTAIDAAASLLESALVPARAKLNALADKYGLGLEDLDDGDKPRPPNTLTEEENRELGAALRDVKFEADRVVSELEQQRGNDDVWAAIRQAKKASSKLLLFASSSEIRRRIQVTTPFFSVDLAGTFISYRNRRLANDLAGLQEARGQHTEINHRSDADFVDIFGRPPWDVVNEVLARLGVDATLMPPPMTSFEAYELTLTNAGGAILPFEGLSSGERVIATLAACGYGAVADPIQPLQPPRVLLLDEVDSPLHPSQIRTFLDVIENVLVGEFGMKVIATTHSPTTVALFKGDTIGLMEKGTPGIALVSKEQALSSLLVGVPRLTVSAHGRRQVFVESPADVENYESLYELLRQRLNSERSLQFVATGTRERNSGIDVVKRIVSDLREKGSESTFGLIDWDGLNRSQPPLIVMAPDRRNGLENVILDPLALGLAIYHDFPQQLRNLALPSARYSDIIARLDKAPLQSIVDSIGATVFGAPQDRVLAEYEGGFALMMDKRFFSTDDHALEEAIITAMPFFLERSKRQAGQLCRYIIRNILSDVPDAIPIEVAECFRQLLG